MKLLLVELLGEFHDEQKVEVILESDNVHQMQGMGLDIARKRGVAEAAWVDWSPPTMGDRKLREPSKFLLEISEKEFLIIQ